MSLRSVLRGALHLGACLVALCLLFVATSHCYLAALAWVYPPVYGPEFALNVAIGLFWTTAACGGWIVTWRMWPNRTNTSVTVASWMIGVASFIFFLALPYFFLTFPLANHTLIDREAVGSTPPLVFLRSTILFLPVLTLIAVMRSQRNKRGRPRNVVVLRTWIVAGALVAVWGVYLVAGLVS